MTMWMVTFIVLSAWQAPQPAPEAVFVCEHGAAKSVIATAYFNKLAAERHLPVRATCGAGGGGCEGRDQLQR